MELTPKEILFVQEYIKNGYNGKRAYMTAYETENENMAAVEAHKMLKKEKIKKALDEEEGGFKEIARVHKADKNAIVKKLSSLIFDKYSVKTKDGDIVEIEPDGKVAIQAITTLMKLTGDFAPEKKEVKLEDDLSKIDTKNMSEKELQDMRSALLSSM